MSGNQPAAADEDDDYDAVMQEFLDRAPEYLTAPRIPALKHQLLVYFFHCEEDLQIFSDCIYCGMLTTYSQAVGKMLVESIRLNLVLMKRMNLTPDVMNLQEN